VSQHRRQRSWPALSGIRKHQNLDRPLIQRARFGKTLNGPFRWWAVCFVLVGQIQGLPSMSCLPFLLLLVPTPKILGKISKSFLTLFSFANKRLPRNGEREHPTPAASTGWPLRSCTARCVVISQGFILATYPRPVSNWLPDWCTGRSQ